MARVSVEGATRRSDELANLFRGRSQLLVYHFMFGPDYTAGCPSCSALADSFNGFAVHPANHDVMLWAVSRAPLTKLQAYKRRMGWTFPWASSFGYNYQREPALVREAGSLIMNPSLVALRVFRSAAPVPNRAQPWSKHSASSRSSLFPWAT